MSESNKILVIRSSADREVALYNVFRYTHNAKKRGRWDEACLLLWGPSDRLLAQDDEL